MSARVIRFSRHVSRFFGDGDAAAPPPAPPALGAPVEDDHPMLYALTEETVDATAAANKVTVGSWPITQSVEGTEASCAAAPIGSDAALNVKVNGVPLLGNDQVIPAGTQKSPQQPAINVAQINQGDRVTFDLTAVGQTQPGRGYKFAIIGRRLGYAPLPVQPPVFNPLTSWPGLIGWVDPSGPEATVSAGSITQVLDKVSGLAFVADGATPVPTENTTVMNGRRSMNITNSHLVCTQAGAHSPFAGTNRPIIVMQALRPGHNASNRFSFSLGSFSATGDASLRIQTATADWAMNRTRANGAENASIAAAAAVVLNAPVIVTAIFDGTTGHLFLNRRRVATGAMAIAHSMVAGGVAIGTNRHLTAPASWWSNNGSSQIGDTLFGSTAPTFTLDGSNDLLPGSWLTDAVGWAMQRFAIA
jgi:hypothetical protein